MSNDNSRVAIIIILILFHDFGNQMALYKESQGHQDVQTSPSSSKARWGLLKKYIINIFRNENNIIKHNIMNIIMIIKPTFYLPQNM